MKTKLLLVLIAADIVIAGAVVLWLTTGQGAWTRFPSEAIARTQAEPEGGGLDDLFADAGLNDDHGELERIDNDFRFGLLPSGLGKESLSVVSVSAVAVIVQVVAFVRMRRKPEAPSEDAIA